MSALGQHVMMRLTDDRVIAPSAADRRRLASIVLRQGRDFGLVGFGAADTHVHLACVCSEQRARELVRRIKIAWTPRQDAEAARFERPRLKPIGDQWHLASTFRYLLSQDRHHGCRVDPYFEATVLPELLFMRLVEPTVAVAVRSLLPRVTTTAVLEQLGLGAAAADAAGTVDAPEVECSPAMLGELVEAAAATLALPDLTGKSATAVRGRRAAAHLAREAASTSELAAVLGVSASAVRRLIAGPVDAPLLAALRRQLRFRRLVDASGAHAGAVSPSAHRAEGPG